MFVSDTATASAFTQGKTFTLKITFSDGSTFTDSTTIGAAPSTTAADIAVTLTAASNPVVVDAVERFTLTGAEFRSRDGAERSSAHQRFRQRARLLTRMQSNRARQRAVHLYLQFVGNQHIPAKLLPHEANSSF